MYSKRGFTIIELILYVALLSIVMTGIISFSLDMLGGRVKSRSQREVQDNLRFAMKRMQYEIRNAASIQSISPADVCLAVPDSTYNPTRFYLVGNRLTVGWGGGSADCQTVNQTAYLTGNQVEVERLAFTNGSSPDGKSQHILISLTIRSVNAGLRQEWNAREHATTSAELRSH